MNRAALDVALELGIPCGGWCPKGRRAVDGVIPARYPMQGTESQVVIDWVNHNPIHVLNVAGPRENKQPGIHDRTVNLLRELL